MLVAGAWVQVADGNRVSVGVKVAGARVGEAVTVAEAVIVWVGEGDGLLVGVAVWVPVVVTVGVHKVGVVVKVVVGAEVKGGLEVTVGEIVAAGITACTCANSTMINPVQ